MNQHEREREMLARRPELSPAEEARLQEHLDGCAACRHTAEAYARQAALLRSLPLADPPPALRAAVLGAVRQPRPSRSPWMPWPLLLGPVAAALVIGAVVLFATGQSHHEGPQASGPGSTPTAVSPGAYAGATPTPVPATAGYPPARHPGETRKVRGATPPAAATRAKPSHLSPSTTHPSAGQGTRPVGPPAAGPSLQPASPPTSAPAQIPQQAPVLSQQLNRPPPPPTAALSPPGRQAAAPPTATSPPVPTAAVVHVPGVAAAVHIPSPTPSAGSPSQTAPAQTAPTQPPPAQPPPPQQPASQGSTPLPIATPVSGQPAAGVSPVRASPTPPPVGESAAQPPELPAAPPRRPAPPLPVVVPPIPLPTPTP